MFDIITQPMAFSYSRVSSDSQSEHGSGIDRQVDRAVAYAEKMGFHLDETLTDRGMSGWSGEHRKKGVFGAFLDRVERGQIAKGSLLIVEAIDRLGRERTTRAMLTLMALIENDIIIVTIQEPVVTYSKATCQANPGLCFMLVGLIQAANIFSQSLSDRLTLTRERNTSQRIKDGEAPTGMLPAWMRKSGKKVEIIPQRGAIVARIFNELAAGKGKDKIVKGLNGEKVLPFTREGQGMVIKKTNRVRPIPKAWVASYITKLATNRAVVGDLMRKSGEVVPGFYPAVIGRDLFEQVSSKRGAPAGRRGKTYRCVLTGLVRCNACGDSMTIADKGDAWRRAKKKDETAGTWLVCSNEKRGAGCTANGMLPYANLEAVVIGTASILTPAHEWYDKQARSDDTLQARMDELSTNIAKRQSQIRRRITLMGDDEDSFDTLREVIRELEDDIKGAKIEIDRLKRAYAKSTQERPRDYEELVALAQTAKTEPDEEKRYEIRERIHSILLDCVDAIIIDTDKNFYFVVMGRGTVIVTVATGKETEVRFIFGENCLQVPTGKRTESIKGKTSPFYLTMHEAFSGTSKAKHTIYEPIMVEAAKSSMVEHLNEF